MQKHYIIVLLGMSAFINAMNKAGLSFPTVYIGIASKPYTCCMDYRSEHNWISASIREHLSDGEKITHVSKNLNSNELKIYSVMQRSSDRVIVECQLEDLFVWALKEQIAQFESKLSK